MKDRGNFVVVGIVAGYETRKTERNVAERNFADAINKAAAKKETNTFRPESSDEVMQALDKALAWVTS